MSEKSVDLDKCFQVINDLVNKAGAIIARRNETRQEYACKQGDIDLVTETDKEVELLLMNGIKEKFPDHKFIGEEESSIEGAPKKLTDSPTWIIDPVDGTMNFVHAFPHSCISVGLVVKKVTEIGIIFNPLLNQRFTARRGQGAFYNDKPIKVSGQKELSKALIISEFGTSRDPEKMKVVIDNFTKISEKAHGFIGEEESSTEGAPKKLSDSPTWIIDPVDGTMNFVHAFPHSSISVGLVVKKVTEIGIVFNPLLNQRFTARRGQGAFYNDKPIKVSGQKELSKALIISEFGISRDPEVMKVVIENFAKISSKVHGVRVLGSAALDMSMVALGGTDAYYEYGIHVWDVCAGDLIVREAGGVVIDPAGGPFDMMSRRVLAAATPELANAVAETLTQFYPKPRDD